MTKSKQKKKKYHCAKLRNCRYVPNQRWPCHIFLLILMEETGVNILFLTAGVAQLVQVIALIFQKRKTNRKSTINVAKSLPNLCCLENLPTNIRLKTDLKIASTKSLTRRKEFLLFEGPYKESCMAKTYCLINIHRTLVELLLV